MAVSGGGGGGATRRAGEYEGEAAGGGSVEREAGAEGGARRPGPAAPPRRQPQQAAGAGPHPAVPVTPPGRQAWLGYLRQRTFFPGHRRLQLQSCTVTSCAGSCARGDSVASPVAARPRPARVWLAAYRVEVSEALRLLALAWAAHGEWLRAFW